jgi:hypothetical protein
LAAHQGVPAKILLIGERIRSYLGTHVAVVHKAAV